MNETISYVETDRLIMRWWRFKDMASLKQYARDPQVASMAGWDPVTSWIGAWDRIYIGYPKPWCFAIVEKQSQKAIGSVSFMTSQRSHVPLQENELEIGYWIAKPYWGQGLVVEAARALIDEILNKTDIERVYVVVKTTNHQSLRVQEKLGFVYNRTEEVYLDHEEKRMPCIIAVHEHSYGG